MSPKLDELPTLVLSLIFDDIQASSPKTLQSLSLVSKACYWAAVPFLYRNFALKISSWQGLREDTARLLEDDPFRKTFLNHVRCLKIWGYMPLPGQDDYFLDGPEDVNNPELTDEEKEYDAEFGAIFFSDLLEGSAEEMAELWSPLVSVIQKCTHLSDLIWVCRNQLPPCLLQILDQYHPSCRLHMRSFRFRSLGDSVTNSHELDLIQSPHLHSISVRTVKVDSNGKTDHNKSALFPVVALAPNLRHLNVVTAGAGASPLLLRTRNRPLEPWNGFMPPLHVPTRGALTSLVYYYHGMSFEDIQEWPKYTDLSKLRHLDLGCVWDPRVIRFMRENVTFASLKSLRAGVESTPLNHEWSVSELESLLEHLEPLEEVYIHGYLTPSVLDKTLKRHGPSLYRLIVHSHQQPYGPHPSLAAISPGDIRNIEMHCQRLEHLRMTVPFSSVMNGSQFPRLCPNLRRLQDLALHVGLRELSAPPGEVARKILDLIDNAKIGSRLSRLIINDLRNTTILTRKYTDGRDQVETRILDDVREPNQEISEKFHGLPTARFRF